MKGFSRLRWWDKEVVPAKSRLSVARSPSCSGRGGRGLSGKTTSLVPTSSFQTH